MKKRLSDLLLLTVGTLLVSAGVYFFKFPNNFSTGGVSGISVILGALLPGISTGTLVLVINVALLLVELGMDTESLAAALMHDVVEDTSVTLDELESQFGADVAHMVDGVTNLVPAAKVGHIGLYRDHKTLQPVEYYNKLPQDITERDVIVLDPMLATGGSAIDAISIVKRSNPKSIKFMCIIAAPEGVKALSEAHPDVQIYCAAVDDHLNEIGYIVPGLGDAGDRIFGTL